MKLKIFLACFAILTPVFVTAQVTSATIKEGDAILAKIQKLNIIKFVTPLLLKKSQINALLTTMEKCRSKELEIRELDAKELKKIDAEITKSIEEATNSGSYPKRELQGKVIKVQDALILRRRIATGEMVDMLVETCNRVLNEGQLAAMRNLVDPQFTEGAVKADKLPDAERTKLYIREIFLNSITYDFLKDLAKHVE